MKPRRIQRRRTKGWQMPENTVYVGRPTKWGNPFPPGKNIRTPAVAVADFSRYLIGSHLLDRIGDLQGKNLACWRDLDQACYADVLLEFANG